MLRLPVRQAYLTLTMSQLYTKQNFINYFKIIHYEDY